MAWWRGLKGWLRLGRLKVGEDPRVGRLGPEWTVSWANAEKIQRKNENGLPMRFGPKCELGFRMDFRIDFKDFEFKSKDLNISKPNFELRSNKY
jgi:hypothetical protein